MSLKILNEEDVLKTLHGSEEGDSILPIVDLLAKQFQAYLTDGEFFTVEYKRGVSAFLLTVSLMKTTDEGTIFDFYVTDRAKMEVINDCPRSIIDFLGHTLETFFREERDARLPLDFTPFSIGNTDVYARQVYRQFALEQQADALLSQLRDD